MTAPQCKQYLFLKFYFSNHIVPIGHFHGSVFVTINARLFLESVSYIQQIFDISTSYCNVRRGRWGTHRVLKLLAAVRPPGPDEKVFGISPWFMLNRQWSRKAVMRGVNDTGDMQGENIIDSKEGRRTT